MSNAIHMIAGERRRVTVKVTVDGDSDFTIRNPSWKLLKDSESVDAGTPNLSGTKLTCMLEPPEAGGYTLEFSFEISGERIIRRIQVYVAA